MCNYVEKLDHREDLKKVWNTINALDENKKKSKPGCEIKDNDKTANTDQEKANLFVKVYARVSRIDKDKVSDYTTVKNARAATDGICKSCNGATNDICCSFTLI